MPLEIFMNGLKACITTNSNDSELVQFVNWLKTGVNHARNRLKQRPVTPENLALPVACLFPCVTVMFYLGTIVNIPMHKKLRPCEKC